MGPCASLLFAQTRPLSTSTAGTPTQTFHTAPDEDYDLFPAGAVYHFTADLSTGTLRVRPVIKHIYPGYSPRDANRTEWTIAEGVSDLAGYTAAVYVFAGPRRIAFALRC
jgi:hypothetical protein